MVFKVLRSWMPDQVRHDGQEIGAFPNYDTTSPLTVKVLELSNTFTIIDYHGQDESWLVDRSGFWVQRFRVNPFGLLCPKMQV